MEEQYKQMEERNKKLEDQLQQQIESSTIKESKHLSIIEKLEQRLKELEERLDNEKVPKEE